VKTAVDAFGKVDILINNAGILRDVSFAKMTQAEWDIVLAVHLTGSMSVSHAAWPLMREQGFGRIVMTTSAAGIYGNFGQANYSAAKLGLVGLANTLAEEGRNKNVYVNTIAPIAASRLTETVLPPDILKHLQPEAVSPLVAWLCHEDCEETKGLFEVGAGYIAKVRWERSYGTTFPLGRRFSVDDVASRWGKITGFEENSENPKTINESMAPILRNITAPSLGGNEFIDLDVASKTSVKFESEYDENDLALYALGIGAARDPLDKSELKFAYEMGGDFQALPTFGVMPQMSAMLKAAREGTFTMPGMSFGFERLLHGEQYMELKGPMPRKGKLTHHFKFKNAYDKDPNAVVTFAISTVDEDGTELAYNEMTSFVKGAGGWGGDRGPSADINVPPAREPDAVIEEKTDVNQTLLFRLSGDWNPLHADPGFAKAFGYDRPILHGLCTFGHAGRHVIKAFCDNDGRKFKSIKVRFAKNVFPGETLVTRMWKESDTRIVFETSVKERNEVVIKNAAVELYKEIPQKDGGQGARQERGGRGSCGPGGSARGGHRGPAGRRVHRRGRAHRQEPRDGRSDQDVVPVPLPQPGPELLHQPEGRRWLCGPGHAGSGGRHAGSRQRARPHHLRRRHGHGAEALLRRHAEDRGQRHGFEQAGRARHHGQAAGGRRSQGARGGWRWWRCSGSGGQRGSGSGGVAGGHAR
jgi:acyl dehydratase